MSMANAETIIRLVSKKDGGSLELPKHVAFVSRLIASAKDDDIDDHGEDETSVEEFEVDAITPVLQLVGEFMYNKHSAQQLKTDQIGNKRKRTTSECDEETLVVTKPLPDGVTSLTGLLPEWCGKFIGVGNNALHELIRTADFMDIEALLDVSLAELACRMRQGASFKMGSIPDPVAIHFLTTYLSIKDIFEMDRRIAEDDVVEWRALLASREFGFNGGWECDRVSLKCLRWITGAGIAIKELTCPRNISDKYLLVLSQSCTMLKSIFIESSNITDAGLVALSKDCPALTTIDLSEYCKKITEVGIIALAKGCPALASFAGFRVLTDPSVIALSENCPALTNIDLFECEVSDEALIALSRGCPSLMTFALHGGDYTDVSDVGLKALSRGCPGLTELRVSNVNGFTDAGFMAIAKRCAALTSVEIGYCDDAITDVGVIAIARGCPSLSSITIVNCDLSYQMTDVGLIALAAGCPDLTHIELRQNHFFTDLGLVALSKGCHHLTSVILEDCQKITFFGVAALFHGCAALTSISLDNCPAIADAGLSESFPSLTDITLRGCPMTDAVLIAISPRWEALSSIDLSSCKGVTDVGVIALSEACRGLTRISLKGCRVTEAGVAALCQACPHLKSVDGVELSDQVVAKIGVDFPQIEITEGMWWVFDHHFGDHGGP